jgi:ribonuclease J
MNVAEYAEIGKLNNLVLLLESTNSEEPGFSISEREARDNLKIVLKDAKGRVIIGAFSSLLERIIEIISVAEELGRKVAIDGYSLKSNIEIMQAAGFFKPGKDVMIPVEKINDYPPEKVIAICTGSQGEENAVLMRVANKKHKYIKIMPKDTIILSSSVIPGNEKSVQILKDNMARQGAKIVHYGIIDVHASGHANQEELKLMTKLINPKFFVPIHGNFSMLKNNSELAMSLGIPEKNIVVPLNNGAMIEVTKDKIEVLAESAPANYVMVDGLGVGDVKEVVLRDRQMLAQDGMFVIIAVIDSKTGRVRNSPDIISRGFIYLRESQDLLKQTRHLIVRTAEEAIGKMHPINITYVKETVRDRVAKFLFQKTKRRPIILPVLIEV